MALKQGWDGGMSGGLLQAYDSSKQQAANPSCVHNKTIQKPMSHQAQRGTASTERYHKLWWPWLWPWPWSC
jgi:hypothetical protein